MSCSRRGRCGCHRACAPNRSGAKPRVLVVRADHPLAGRESISILETNDEIFVVGGQRPARGRGLVDRRPTTRRLAPEARTYGRQRRGSARTRRRGRGRQHRRPVGEPALPARRAGVHPDPRHRAGDDRPVQPERHRATRWSTRSARRRRRSRRSSTRRSTDAREQPAASRRRTRLRPPAPPPSAPATPRAGGPARRDRAPAMRP